MFSPETNPVIGAALIRADQLLDTAKPICLKNAKGAWIFCMHYTGGNTDVVLTVHEGATAAVATAGTYPITTGAEFPIYVTSSIAASDVPSRITDALTYTIDADVLTGTSIVMFYIDASKLTNGRDWIALGATGGNAASIAAVWYVLVGSRYQQLEPPTAIA